MKNGKTKVKCLALLSGGLDSILAVKILQKQGIVVTGLCFASYFFNSELAERAAEWLGIDLKVVDISDEHLKMVKSPVYGYGKNANPCIDCHLMMLRKAKEILLGNSLFRNSVSKRTRKPSFWAQPRDGFDFVATGEVLGERPMSQNKGALELLEKESGLSGYLLRPLSARLLEPTILEKDGWVEREKLLAISGRQRKEQMALAKEFGLKDYPTPSGGCLLTDPEFGKRLKELFKRWPDCGGNDVLLLKLGRHFWVGDDKIVVGRNEKENAEIKKLSQEKDVIMEPKDYPGPTVLVRGKGEISEEMVEKAKELMRKYSGKKQLKVRPFHQFVTK